MEKLNQSRVSLAKIKHAEFASEETHCFSAEVVFDGRVVALVSNDGHGGSDNWYPARKGETMADALNAKMDIDAFAATLPPAVCSWNGPDGQPEKMAYDADLLVGTLIEEWSRAKHDKNRIKRAQKLLATKTTFIVDGVCRTYKSIVPPEIRVRLFEKYPSAEIINDLPFEVAFAKLEAARAI